MAGFCTLAAVTVTVWVAAMVEGATYRPLDRTAPTDGLMDQVTAWLTILTTVVLNCWVWLGPSEILLGLTCTVAGAIRVILAQPNLFGSATLVASTSTVLSGGNGN